jgi:DNA-binding NarL/FixJ family response regulator
VASVVTLVLADHHALFAEGLEMLLGAEDDLAVLDVAHNAGRAVESVTEHQPAVLVVDAQLPAGELVETLATVRAASPMTKLLVLSGAGRSETTAALIAAGADGVLAKDRSSRQVVTAIRELAAGAQAMVLAAEPSRLGRDPSVELRVQTLSCREREILGLLAIGWSNRRIAEGLRLSYLTVRSHMQNLLVKLGVHSQLEAVAFAVEHGVVAAGDAGAWERSSA